MSSNIIRTFSIAAVCLLLNNSSYSQGIDKIQAQTIADRILVTKKYKAVIKKILPLVNNIQAIVLEPPYREFPSIIFVYKDKTTKTWQRTFECLSPGIQDAPSGLLDWHTVGKGVDFEIGDKKLYHFTDHNVVSFVESAATKGIVIIPYQNFLHMNDFGGPPPAGFAPYIIDKTNYFDCGNIFFDNKYKSYPTNECTMYDSPRIVDVDFSAKDNKYTIKATTDNKQLWIYTFDGIDAKGQYLINKKIIVQKI